MCSVDIIAIFVKNFLAGPKPQCTQASLSKPNNCTHAYQSHTKTWFYQNLTRRGAIANFVKLFYM